MRFQIKTKRCRQLSCCGATILGNPPARVRWLANGLTRSAFWETCCARSEYSKALSGAVRAHSRFQGRMMNQHSTESGFLTKAKLRNRFLQSSLADRARIYWAPVYTPARIFALPSKKANVRPFHADGIGSLPAEKARSRACVMRIGRRWSKRRHFATPTRVILRSGWQKNWRRPFPIASLSAYNEIPLRP